MVDRYEHDTFSELLAAEIDKRRISQAEAAKLLGVTQPSLHHWLRGANLPAPKNFKAISKFTGYPVTRLQDMRRNFRRDVLSVQRVADLESELRALRRTVDRIADRLDALERDR